MNLLKHLKNWAVVFALASVSSCGNGVDSKEKVLPKASSKDGGSATERRMAALVRGHSSQKRTDLVWDAKLTSAARKRARDMGERAYFSHVDPDGHGPNWYVTQAGYSLPIKWKAFKAANQVESILAGHSTAEKAFSRWMESQKHVSHLLALNPFYQDQTRFGIGHVVVPNSPWLDYWVFVSAPPET
ncbi:MAG: hypothetical protein ACJAVK_002718 [Akkermansiaceae bacterium]|jgi:uncharacterized protein YkwD